MARPKIPAYITNVVKSTGYAVADVTKDMFPSVSGFVSTNTELAKTVLGTIRNHRDVIKTTHTQLIGSDVMRSVDNLKKNAIADLKSGQFYNKSRSGPNIFDSGDDFNFGADFDFGDYNFDDTSSGNVTVINQGAGSKAIAAASITGAKATMASADYIVSNQRAQHALSMATDMKTFNMINQNLDNVSGAILALSEFNTGVTKSFYDASTEYYRESSTTMKSQLALIQEFVEMQRALYGEGIKEANNNANKRRTESPIHDVLGYDGFNIENYVKNVISNTRGIGDSFGLGMVEAGVGMVGGMSGIIDAMAQSPLKAISKFAVSALIPKGTKLAAKELDESFKSWGAAALLRINEWEDDWENPLKQMLGRIFGIKLDNKTDVSLGDYNKGAAAFDGITRKAIIEVIPGYLSKILSAVSGQEERVFDYESGKFKSKAEVIADYERSKNSNVSYDVKDALIDNIDKSGEITSAEMDRRVKADVDKYLLYYANKGKLPDPRRVSYDKLYDMKLEGGEESYNLIKKAFLESEKSIQMSLAPSIVDFKKAQADRMQYLTRTMDITGLSAALNDKSLNKESKVNIKSSIGNPVDVYGKGQLDYLRDILGALYNGIIVYTNPGVAGKGNPGLSTIIKRNMGFKTDTQNVIDSNNRIIAAEEEKKRADEEAFKNRKFMNHEERERERQLEKLAEYTNKPIEELREEAKKSANFGEYMKSQFKSGANIGEGEDAKKKGILGWIKNTSIYKRGAEFKQKMKESSLNPFNILKRTMEAVSTEIYTSIYGRDDEDDEDETDPTKSKNPVKRLFGKLMQNVFNPIGDFLKTNILNPLEFHLFDKEKGIITRFNKFIDEKVVNRIKDWYKDSPLEGMMKNIFGEVKGFTFGATEGKYAGNNSILGNMRSMFFDGIYNPFMSTMFGDKVEMVNDKGEKYFVRKGGGLFDDIKDEFKNLASGFGKLIFGDSEDGDVNKKRFASFFKDVKIDLPKFGGGAGIGVLGSLFLPGGPLLGALVGGFGTLASKSDKFREFLFGNDDKEGIFKKKWGDWFKDKFPQYTAASGLGIIGSFFLPGGPLLGAITGIGIKWAKNSEQFQKFMFGETDEDGNIVTKGLISKDWIEKFKGLLPSGLAGSLVGGLSIGGPFGLVAGAVMGSALKYVTNMDKFQDFMFGEKDENGKRTGGLRGEVLKVINKSIVEPLKKKFDAVKLSVGTWFTENIGKPFKNGLDPFLKEIKLFGKGIKDSFSNMFKSITDKFNETVTKPIADMMEEHMLKPMRKVLDKIFNRIGKIIGAIVSAPFKAFSSMGDTLRKKHIKSGDADYMTEEEIAEFKKNQNPFFKFFAGLENRGIGSIFETLFGGTVSKLASNGAVASEKIDKARTKSASAIEEAFGKISAIFDKSNYGQPKFTKAEVKHQAIVNDEIDPAWGEKSSDSEINMSEKINGRITSIRIKGDKKILGGIKNFFKMFSVKDTDDWAYNDKYNELKAQSTIIEGWGDEDTKPVIPGIVVDAKDYSNKPKTNKEDDTNKAKIDAMTVDAEDFTGKNASTDDKKKKKKSSTFSPRELFTNIKGINANTAKIKSEVEGQLDGSGYNLELIANILVDQFGNPSWLPTKLKRGVRGNYKKQGFFEGLLSGVKTNILNPLGGMFRTAMTPIFMVGDALKATANAALEVGKEILMLPIDIFRFGLTSVKVLGESLLEGVKAFGPALGEILKGASSIVAGFARGIGFTLEATGYVAAEALRGVSTIAIDLSLAFGQLVSKGVPMLMGAMLDMTTSIVDMTSKVIASAATLIGKSVTGTANFVARMFSNEKRLKDTASRDKVQRVHIEGGQITKILDVDTVKKVIEIERVLEVRRIKDTTQPMTGDAAINIPQSIKHKFKQTVPNIKNIKGPKSSVRGSGRSFDPGYMAINGTSALQVGVSSPQPQVGPLLSLAPQTAPSTIVNGPVIVPEPGAELNTGILKRLGIAAKEKTDAFMARMPKNVTDVTDAATDTIKKAVNIASRDKTKTIKNGATIDKDKLKPVGLKNAANIIAKTKEAEKERREEEILELTRRNTEANESQLGFFVKKAKNVWDGLLKFAMVVPKLLGGLGGLIPLLGALPFIIDKVAGLLGFNLNLKEGMNSMIEETPVEDYFDRAPGIFGRRLAKTGTILSVKGGAKAANSKLGRKVIQGTKNALVSGLDKLGTTKVGKAMGDVVSNNKFLAKISDALLDILTKPSVAAKIGGKEIAERVAKEVIENGLKKSPKLLAKLGAKLASYSAMGIGLVIDAAFFLYDYEKGLMDVHNIFKTDPTSFEPTLAMYTAAGLGQAISGLLLGIPEPGWLAGIIYKAVGKLDTEAQQTSLTFAQEQLKTAHQKHNAETGENLTLDQYNDKVNKTSKFGNVMGSMGKKAGRAVLSTVIPGSMAIKGIMDNKGIMSNFGLDDKSQITAGHRSAMGVGTQLEAMTFGLINAQKTAHLLYGGFTNIGDILGSIPKTISDSAKWVMDIPKNLAKGVLGDKYDAVAEFTEEKILNPLLFIRKVFALPGYMIRKTITNLTADIRAAIPGWMSNFSKGFDEFTTELNNNWNEIVKNVGIGLKDFGVTWDKQVNQPIRDLFAGMGEWWNKHVKPHTDKAVVVIKEGVDYVVTPFKNIVTDLQEIFKGLGDTMKRTFDKFKPHWDGFVNWVSGTMNWFGEIGDKANQFFEFDKYFDSDNKWNMKTKWGLFGGTKPFYQGKEEPVYGTAHAIGATKTENNWLTKALSTGKTILNNAKNMYQNNAAGLKPSTAANDIDGTKGAVALTEEDVEKMNQTNAGPGGVFYSQFDARWAKLPFTTQGDSKRYDISEAGCGPTSAAMVASTINKAPITPDMAAKFAIDGGFKEVNGGTKFDFFPAFAKKHKIDVLSSNVTNEDEKSKILSALTAGTPTILMGKGGTLFGKNPHYVVATGYADGRIYVNDPSSDRPNQSFTAQEVLPYATKAFFHQKDKRRGGLQGLLDIFTGLFNSIFSGGQYQGQAALSGMFASGDIDGGESLIPGQTYSEPAFNVQFDAGKWMTGDLDAHPWFMQRIKDMAIAHDKPVHATYGYRTFEEQERLYNNASAADKAAGMVAKPTKEPNVGGHRIGLAMDLNTSNTWLKNVNASTLASYGLWRPFTTPELNEPWHYEPVETGYPDVKERARLIRTGELFKRWGRPGSIGNAPQTMPSGNIITPDKTAPTKPTTPKAGATKATKPTTPMTQTPVQKYATAQVQSAVKTGTNLFNKFFGKGKEPVFGMGKAFTPASVKTTPKYGMGNTTMDTRIQEIGYKPTVVGETVDINNFAGANDTATSQGIRTAILRKEIINNNPGMSSQDIERMIKVLLTIAENTSEIANNTENVDRNTKAMAKASGKTESKEPQNPQPKPEQDNKPIVIDRSHFTNLSGGKSNNPKAVTPGISSIAKGRKL